MARFLYSICSECQALEAPGVIQKLMPVIHAHEQVAGIRHHKSNDSTEISMKVFDMHIACGPHETACCIPIICITASSDGQLHSRRLPVAGRTQAMSGSRVPMSTTAVLGLCRKIRHAYLVLELHSTEIRAWFQTGGMVHPAYVVIEPLLEYTSRWSVGGFGDAASAVQSELWTLCCDSLVSLAALASGRIQSKCHMFIAGHSTVFRAVMSSESIWLHTVFEQHCCRFTAAEGKLLT